jgi:hypothetical protein
LYCKRLRWLERNAEAIEAMMMEGLSVRAAIAAVSSNNRPTCLCCGGVIRHGTRDRHFFCRKHPECRRMRRRYKYLVYDKRYSKEKALNLVLQQEAA